MAYQYTTNAQKTAPAAAVGAVVTPNNTAYANSAWATIQDPMTAASVLTGIAFRTTSTTVGQYEIDIGVGAAASEVVIATIKGMCYTLIGNSANGMYIPFAIPIDAIPNASRVAARLRTQGGSVTTWNISITYLEKPIVGSLQVTTHPTKVVPSAASLLNIQSGASSWANGTWGQLSASTSTDWIIAGVSVWSEGTHGFQYEADIGIGAAASEVVIATLKAGYCFQSSAPFLIMLPNPLDAIPLGSRVAMRVRTSASPPFHNWNFYVGLTYYEGPL